MYITAVCSPQYNGRDAQLTTTESTIHQSNSRDTKTIHGVIQLKLIITVSVSYKQVNQTTQSSSILHVRSDLKDPNQLLVLKISSSLVSATPPTPALSMASSSLPTVALLPNFSAHAFTT